MHERLNQRIDGWCGYIEPSSAMISGGPRNGITPANLDPATIPDVSRKALRIQQAADRGLRAAPL